MTEELDEQAVIGTMLFVQSKSTRELAEFILFLQRAVDGLTKNNKSFVDSYRKMADRQEENKKLREALEQIASFGGGTEFQADGSWCAGKAREALQ